jgi:GT2 family glycosyltransferase
MRCYGHTREQAEKLIKPRVKALEKHQEALAGHVRVDFQDIKDHPFGLACRLKHDLNLDATNEQIDQAASTSNQKEKEAKVFVAVPTMGTVHTNLMAFLLKARGYTGYRFSFTYNEQPVEQARNKLVREFLASDCTHLLFIDSDTVPPDHTIVSMLRADKDVVAGLVPAMKLDVSTGEWAAVYTVFNMIRDQHGDVVENRNPDGHGLQPIDRAGTACMLIRREVLENIPSPRFLTVMDEAGISHLGEDFYFCDKAREHGFEVWANMHVVCKHAKTVNL